MALKGRDKDEEEERKYYQGPSERISLIIETEYKNASHPFVKNEFISRKNRRGKLNKRNCGRSVGKL
jgi:hypothetical protein